MAARVQSRYLTAEGMPPTTLYWWECRECGMQADRTYITRSMAVSRAVGHDLAKHNAEAYS